MSVVDSWIFMMEFTVYLLCVNNNSCYWEFHWAMQWDKEDNWKLFSKPQTIFYPKYDREGNFKLHFKLIYNNYWI